MPRANIETAVLAAALILVCGTAALASNRQELPDGAPASVKMTVDGPVLVSTAGMTLYIYTGEDTKAETFSWQCTNIPPQAITDNQSGIGDRPPLGVQFGKSCTQKYPPYLAAANAQPVGDFSIVDRPGIGRQWTYRNFPLYMSVKDRSPGDRWGLGVAAAGGNNRRAGWSFALLPVERPSGFAFVRRDEGLVLATAVGERPVYTPRGGERLIRVSAGTQLEEFEPVRAPAIGLTSSDWSIIGAGAGRQQYAFKGKPLYAAPIGTKDFEISTSGWDVVTIERGPGLPADIGKQMALVGEVYTDKAGRTLYHYTCNAGGNIGGGNRVITVPCDDAGDSAAYMVALCGDSKECARRWRPYIAPANARPLGDWSVVDITYPMFTDMRGTLYPSDAPRAKAWAYRGKPVFTYYEDAKAGDILGDGVKGGWGSNFNAVVVPGRNIGD